MEKNVPPPPSPSFNDFPEDVQLCILSFLHSSELSAFASTSKRFLSLCRHDHRLWYAMCHRRWGSKTQINKWGSGKISYKHLYRILNEYDNLIGFWRRCGDSDSNSNSSSAPLVFFEWGPICITGSRISPSRNSGYGVMKKPFIYISVTSNGEEVTYLDPDGKFTMIPNLKEDLIGELGALESELIRVNVSFMGKFHVVVEENSGFYGFTRVVSSPGSVRGEEFENVYGSPPDRIMSEIYQYFANRTSPGGNGASRRQRRREKEKQGRMKRWETQHFVKIVNCSPNPGRPLQGLWKGICDDMSLDFYLVSYDDIGGIACRKVGDSSKPLSYHAPVFWTSSTTFIESPFSHEEDRLYNCRLHLQPPDEAEVNRDRSDNRTASRMLFINSSYDLVIPDLDGNALNPRHVEGRIWQYRNGTFGFGFLKDNYIIDMKHIAKDGHLLDTIESGNS
ncbi:hypothetical protein ACJIZ3_013583 [Penstemon smallii]|uniref:F-box protein n=1 Tax=Penstemon smallii TaxID=265156 RepID=A0ABD3RH13_9LAMI